MTDYSEPDYGKSEGDSRRFRDQGNNFFKVKGYPIFKFQRKNLIMYVIEFANSL